MDSVPTMASCEAPSVKRVKAPQQPNSCWVALPCACPDAVPCI